MSDPQRLRKIGSDDDRRLLRSAGEIRVPDHLKEQVRHAVDRRRTESPRRRRVALVLGLAGAFVATAVAAQSLGLVQSLWTSLSQNAPARGRDIGTPPRPQITALHRPEAALGTAGPWSQAATEKPTRSTGRTLVPAGQEPQIAINPTPYAPLEKPDLDLPRLLRGETEVVPKAPPSPAPARIVISRTKRKDIVLQFAEGRLRGDVRGMSLSLSITSDTVTGRLGDDELLIRILGTHRAQGSVGGRDLGFTFNPTETGCIVGASLPEHGGRVELDVHKLSFLPGCNRDLNRDSKTPTSFAGTCADGTNVRVDLPAPFLALPELVRMVVLGLLLPEPEVDERNGRRGLFPEP